MGTEDFKTYAASYGLQPSDLGRQFQCGEYMYTITGLKPRSPKYPILGKRVLGGGSYKFPASAVKAGLVAA